MLKSAGQQGAALGVGGEVASRCFA